MIELLNCDCMEYMATVPDKYFDLAVVDPPYGIGCDGVGMSGRKSNSVKFKNYQGSSYTGGKWDSSPPEFEYFKELLRVSKNQII